MIIAAAVAGGAWLVLSGGDDFPGAWDERAAPIAAWVAQERGLEFDHPVTVNFLTPAEYSAVSQVDPDSAEEQSEEIDDMVAEMRALGLVDGEVDLASSFNTLTDTGTLAFYSTAAKEVYVRGQTLTPGLRVTLAHELVHVLQDQHFDLDAELSSTRSAVLRAVAEGDAGRIEDQYVDGVLSDTERTAYEKETSESGSQASETILDEVPDVLTALFSAPYVFGEPLVTYLFELDGQAAINEALTDPPSEEVLFNPTLWRTPEAEPVPVEVQMPTGATELRSDDFGPIAWYLLLSSRLSPNEALTAVDGLGGDAYVTYRDGASVCVRAAVLGDDAASTEVFAGALTAWIAGGPVDAATLSRDDDGTVRLQACDPGDGAVGSSVTIEVLALPVTRTMIYMESLGSGATAGQAECFSSSVVQALTLEQLIDPNGASNPVVTDTVMTAMTSCMGG